MAVALLMTSFASTERAQAQESDPPAWVRFHQSESGPSHDDVRAIASDARGDLYVTGQTAYPPLGHTIQTIKYAGDGAILWKATIENENNSNPAGIAVGGDGFLYVFGSHLLPDGTSESLVIKYDAATGRQVWMSRHRGVFRPSGLAVDSHGNVFLSGEGATEAGVTAGLTLKLRADGTREWSSSFSASKSHIYAIVADGDGGVYATGSRNPFATGANLEAARTVHYGPGGSLEWVDEFATGRYIRAHMLEMDTSGNLIVAGKEAGLFVLKYNAAGNRLWTTEYSDMNYPAALTLDEGGAAYVTGYDLVSRVCKEECPDDFITVKLANDGSLAWTHRYEGVDYRSERPTDILVDSTNLYIAGYSTQGLLLSYDTRDGTLAAVVPMEEPRRGSIFLARGGTEGLYVAGVTASEETGEDMLVRRFRRGSLQQEWADTFDGRRTSYDQASDMQIDDFGNVYLTGRYRFSSFMTQKYDAFGDLEWTALYEGSHDRSCMAAVLAVDNSQNVYVTGQCGAPNETEDLDILTLKYKPDGSLAWTVKYDGPGGGADIPSSIVVDAGGSVYVSGASVGTEGQRGIIVMKYDTEGRQAWVTRHEGPPGNFSTPNGMALGPEGYLYLTGSARTTAGDDDFLTIKVDIRTGDILWKAWYGGSAGSSEAPVGLALGPTGDVYVAGGSVASQANSMFVRHGYGIVKYDSDGQEQWSAFYGGLGSNGAWAESMGVDGGGNVYVAGQSRDDEGAEHFVVAKFDSYGQKDWIGTYGKSDGTSEVDHMIVDGEGFAYATGRSAELLTVVIRPDGSVQRELRFDAPQQARTEPVGLRVDQGGNVFLGGTTLRSFTALKYNASSIAIEDEDEVDLPGNSALGANYPNPFIGLTTVPFELSRSAHVTVTVHDLLGRRVRNLLNERRPAGKGEIRFDAQGLTSGVYFYRLKIDGRVTTRRMTLIAE